jgi:hypothetical protein
MGSIGDIYKIVQTAFNQTQAIEVQAFIFDLQTKINELQAQTSDLKEQNLNAKSDLQEKIFQYQQQIVELQKIIDQQKREIADALDWKKTKSEYNFDDRLGIWIHKTTSKPFCPKCFDRKAETPLRGSNHNGIYYCPVCNLGF